MARSSKSEDARAAPSGDQPRGVEFALDSFDVADGRLVVAGRWYGVTGRRFVRPVLHAHGQRRLIALLDHKPWAAEEGAAWLAAFPDEGNLGPSRLQVAPDIAIELPAAGPEVGDGIPRPARLTRTRERRSSPADEPIPVETPTVPPQQTSQDRRRIAEVVAERDAAVAEVEAMRQRRDEASADADRLRAQLDQARRESERVQSELDHARKDLDRLRAELSHVRAEANTLRVGHDEARAKAERLEADVTRLRTDAHRALSERTTAQQGLERLRRTTAGRPYIAPRPMAFQELEPGPSWRVRALGAALVLAALGVLLQLLFGVL